MTEHFGLLLLPVVSYGPRCLCWQSSKRRKGERGDEGSKRDTLQSRVVKRGVTSICPASTTLWLVTGQDLCVGRPLKDRSVFSRERRLEYELLRSLSQIKRSGRSTLGRTRLVTPTSTPYLVPTPWSPIVESSLGARKSFYSLWQDPSYLVRAGGVSRLTRSCPCRNFQEWYSKEWMSRSGRIPTTRVYI